MGSSQTYGNIVVAGDAWSLQDQINQMQGLISLSTQDDKAFRSVSQKEIHDNDLRITELKSEVNISRTALSKITPEDDRILKTAFKQYPFEYRVLRYKTCEEAKDYMDDKVLQLHRELEKLKVYRQEQKSKVVVLKANLDSLLKMLESGPLESLKSRIRYLETEIIKVRIHFYASNLIGRRYDAILDNLKQDEYCYPGLIERLEKAAVHQSEELRDVKRVCIQSQHLKNMLKDNLTSLEFEIFQVKRDRDKQIKKMRKDVEKRSEIEVKKPLRLTEDYGDIAQTILQREADNALLENFKKEIDFLLEAAKVSDLKFFLTSWKLLLKASVHLQAQSELNTETRNTLSTECNEKHSLKQKLIYTDTNPDPKGLTNERLDKELAESAEKLWMTTSDKHLVGGLVQDIKLGLENLQELMKTVQLNPAFQFEAVGDFGLDVILRCKAVSSQVMHQAVEEGGEAFLEDIVQSQFANMKPDELVMPDKARIPIAEMMFLESGGYQLEESDVVFGLTREQVRALGQALIDANTKKKRKKSKRRR